EELTQVGNFTGQAQDGLGGWTVDVHDSYDPLSAVINFGDGTNESAESLPNIINLALPNPTIPFNGQQSIDNFLVDPQGNIFMEGFGLPDGVAIIKIGPDGTVTDDQTGVFPDVSGAFAMALCVAF